MANKFILMGLCLLSTATLQSRAEDPLKPKDLESLGTYLKSLSEAERTRLNGALERSKLAAESSKLFAEAQKTIADGRRSFFEAGRVRSETALNFADATHSLAKTTATYAEAVRTLADAQLKEALRVEAYARVQDLWLHTRITDYEFNRLIKGDMELTQQTKELRGHLDIVVALVEGRASWRTWISLNYLMKNTGASEFIQAVMFATKVPPLKFEGNFRSNDRNLVFPAGGPDFPGGNLGSLVNFAKKHEVSFEPYGEAHEFVLKIVNFVKPGTEMSIDKLRQLNQSLRLTIAAFK